IPIENSPAKFDLNLLLTETDTGLLGSWEYCLDLFDEITIERMARHFTRLLTAIVENVSQPLWQLPLLSESECQQLLIEWNDTTVDYPNDKCVHQLFEEQVQRTPDATAVLFESERLTYQQLNARANQLAHYLRRQGVGPESLVGICLERSIEMVVALLGILKAGAAYVPLDPAYPQERQVFMLADTNTSVLLTQQNLLASLSPGRAKMLCLDADWPLITANYTENGYHSVAATNLAYVIYTSGSTGKPKGVAMTQGALLNLICWQMRVAPIKLGERVLQFTSLSFDVSFQEIFSTLCAGGTLVLIKEETRRDSLALLKFLEGYSIEKLFLPFVALQNLAEAAKNQSGISLCLRDVITAGERLQITPSIYNWFASMRNCLLHNHYGPSESHAATAFILSDAPIDWPTLPPIGKPIFNTEIYILDLALQPVPVGVAGELYIGGTGLARGYLNRSELTAERFIPNPYSAEAGARLYCTGDLARYIPDGNIEYLGRIDQQVKVRGYRIELGEIETTLREYRGICESAVVVQDQSPSDKRLIAYFVANRDSEINIGELQAFLKEKLPEYMLPSALVLLDRLPLTPNGKVDQRALPAPQMADIISSESYLAPRSPIEEILIEIWTSVLKVDQIGVNDNFFELGGHSLLATQLMSRVRDTFRIEIALRNLFECPTVAGLA
ncbi:MAG: amino acid adenylation domain-containing protein, partial [Acidobacteriota bacterium]